jgi:predicted metal-dependent hydrolase
MPDLMPPRAFGLRALLFRRPRNPSVHPSVLAVTHEQTVYPVRVRRNRRARRYTLRIQSVSREVVLTMPLRGSLTQARDFAERHGAWIAARLARLPQPVAFEPGAVVPLRGEPHRIVHRPDRRGTVWTETGADGERLLCVAGASGHLARRLRDFLKREARRDLDAASRAAAQRLGVTVKRVSVRDQASRWGSCSTSGALSYSWRLVLAPPFVLTYLAAHEVAHLVEMNHSAAFWRVVKRLDPGMERARAWVAAHGGDLHRYDPPRRRAAVPTPH